MQNETLVVSFNRKRLSWWKAKCCQWSDVSVPLLRVVSLTCLESEGIQKREGVLSGLSWSNFRSCNFKLRAAALNHSPSHWQQYPTELSTLFNSSQNILACIVLSGSSNKLSPALWQREGDGGTFSWFLSQSQRSACPYYHGHFFLAGGRQ